MNILKYIALFLLLFALPACGDQLVEFDQGNGGASGRGVGGEGGASGEGGRGGRGGTGGLGEGGTGGDAAGSGGDAGSGGSGGDAGSGGSGGDAGSGGGGGEVGGNGGDAGSGGEVGGNGGDAGSGGSGGDVGTTPRVVSTNPADQDTNVAINMTIRVVFSENMQPLTTNEFTVTGPGATPVVGQVVHAGDTAIFTPLGNLAPNTLYTATIADEATALTGGSLTDDHVWSFRTGTEAAQRPQRPLSLGSASRFVILASAAITNIATSRIVGDVGLSPDAGSNVTGFSQPASCPEVTGEVYVVDGTGPACARIDPARLTNAKIDAGLAFVNANAAVRGPPQVIAGDLNGLTLYPGLYQSGSSIEISPGGFLYLDAQGDPNAVFIIRSATTITTGATSQVVLTKAANAANVYWTAGSAVTLGTNSTMKGNLIAGTSISLLTGAALEGRALNQGPSAAAVSLDASTLILP